MRVFTTSIGLEPMHAAPVAYAAIRSSLTNTVNLLSSFSLELDSEAVDVAKSANDVLVTLIICGEVWERRSCVYIFYNGPINVYQLADCRVRHFATKMRVSLLLASCETSIQYTFT